jgi:hypothetical protein
MTTIMLMTVESKTGTRVIGKVTLLSPCLWASFHPISNPLSAGIGKVKSILLNLSMKFRNSV